MKRKARARKKRRPLKVDTDITEYNDKLDQKIKRGEFKRNQAPSHVRRRRLKEVKPTELSSMVRAPTPSRIPRWHTERRWTRSGKPSLMKSSDIRNAMDRFVEAFREANQRPPGMVEGPRTTDGSKGFRQKDPTPSFLIEACALIDRWPQRTAQKFLFDVAAAGVPPEHAQMSKRVKEILHELFDVDEKNWTLFHARWRMWPRRIESVDDRLETRRLEAAIEKSERAQSGDSGSSDNNEESEMFSKKKSGSKQAVNKKVASKKASTKKSAAKPTKVKAPGSKSRITKDTKLVVVKGAKLDDVRSDRQKKAVEAIQKSNGGVAGALMKKHGRMIIRSCIAKGLLKPAA